MNTDNKTITYTSPNGYTGVLYGESSFIIKDKDGKTVLHTGFRNFNTYEELKERVDEHPEFIKMLSGISEDDDIDDDVDI